MSRRPASALSQTLPCCWQEPLTDAAHGHALLAILPGREAVEDEVQGLEPHGHGGVDFAGGGLDVDALFDAILGTEVGVKVYFCLADYSQGRVDDDGWGWR